MQIAEKLYTKGFISYPRTETNMFAKDIDLASLVRMQTQDQQWGGNYSGLTLIAWVSKCCIVTLGCDRGLKICNKPLKFNHGLPQEIFTKHDQMILLNISLAF